MANVESDSCDCLPDCESTEYQYALTSSSIRWDILEKLGSSCFEIYVVVAFKMIWETFRLCDSRNLNLEPLCTLETGTSPKLWLEQVIQSLSAVRCQASRPTLCHHLFQVEDVYNKTDSSLPHYIKSIISPTRGRHFDNLIKMPSQVRK